MPLRAPLGAFAFATVVSLTFCCWVVSSAEPRAEAAPLAGSLRAESQPAQPVTEHPSFRLSVISDLNQSYGSTRYGSDVHGAIQALTERLRPALVLITGDMVAGQKQGVDAPAMWRAFHEAVTEPLRKANIVVAPTPGNHDASPAFQAERAEYVRQWSTRREGLLFIDDSAYPLRYSFSFNGAFFLSLDAASVGPLSAEQREWVEEQLRRAADYSVKIAFGHLPLYSIAHGREREVINDAKLEALFERHGVKLYASGHHHAFYPGATARMRHLAMPCLGSGSRPLIGRASRSARALVIAEVEADDVASIEAFAAPDFTQPIARASLPSEIALGKRVLWRDDVMSARLALLSALDQ